jgi:hypothetical protein
MISIGPCHSRPIFDLETIEVTAMMAWTALGLGPALLAAYSVLRGL